MNPFSQTLIQHQTQNNMNFFSRINPITVPASGWRPIPRDKNGNILWSELHIDCFFGGFTANGEFVYFFSTRDAYANPKHFETDEIQYYIPVQVNPPQKSALQLEIEEEAFRLYPIVNQDKSARDQFIAGAMFVANKMKKANSSSTDSCPEKKDLER